MKKKFFIVFVIAAGALFLGNTQAFAEPTIGVVNFKECVEKSKQGAQEKNSFELLKSQMMETVEKAEKELTQIAEKLEDQDYMDGLSPAAEEELKVKFQQLSQEFSRYQNQYYQLLNQANYRMLQSLHTFVANAAETIRKEKSLLAVFNQDSFFAYEDYLDLTKDVIAKMDADFEKATASPTGEA